MPIQVNERVKREQEFHNEWARSIKIEELLIRESFEAPTAVENQYVLRYFGNIGGKKILDLGCGAGESAVYFALCGAEVYACDVAEEFLEVAERTAGKWGVNLNLSHAEAGKLPYPDNFFDQVYANGVLHHVELVPTLKEIRRVLKKEGQAAFIEPLPYNPLINVYRHLARGVRTEDEKPLSFRQIREVRPYFSSLDHEEFWLFTLFIFVHFYLVKKWDPSKVRYWKKILEEGESYRRMFQALQKWDNFFLKALPFLKPLCWNTVIVARK